MSKVQCPKSNVLHPKLEPEIASLMIDIVRNQILRRKISVYANTTLDFGLWTLDIGLWTLD